MEEGAIYFHIIYSLQLHINTRFVMDLPRYLIPRTLSLRLTPRRTCKGISQLRYSLIKFYPVIVWTGPDTLHTKRWSKDSVLHYSHVDLLKVRPMTSQWSLLTLEVSGVPSVGKSPPHSHGLINRLQDRAAVIPLWSSLLVCIIPSPPGNKFQSELLFLRPSFILLNQNPLSISSFVPSSCFHGYPSLCSVHYLSLPPFPSLSLSLCSYLSHFAFISASLPPALSHTLLSPTFISFHFHLSFTFFSPSSLPFHHPCFWFLLMERKFYRFPCQFCICNHFQFIQPTFHCH